MSLRKVHLVFILVVVAACEMFGAWGVWAFANGGGPATLVAAVLSFLAGFALIGYVLWLVRKFEKAKIE